MQPFRSFTKSLSVYVIHRCIYQLQRHLALHAFLTNLKHSQGSLDVHPMTLHTRSSLIYSRRPNKFEAFRLTHFVTVSLTLSALLLNLSVQMAYSLDLSLSFDLRHMLYKIERFLLSVVIDIPDEPARTSLTTTKRSRGANFSDW